MRFAAFDVVVVPFPYSDRLAEKRRPALVVSSERVAADLGRIWVAMITSAAATEFGDASILDTAASGLTARSIVRASKIATLDADRVLRRAGALGEEDRTRAAAALAACAGFG